MQRNSLLLAEYNLLLWHTFVTHTQTTTRCSRLVPGRKPVKRLNMSLSPSSRSGGMRPANRVTRLKIRSAKLSSSTTMTTTTQVTAAIHLMSGNRVWKSSPTESWPGIYSWNDILNIRLRTTMSEGECIEGLEGEGIERRYSFIPTLHLLRFRSPRPCTREELMISYALCRSLMVTAKRRTTCEFPLHTTDRLCSSY